MSERRNPLWTIIAGIGTLGAAVGVIVATTDFGARLWERYVEGYEKLPGSYANEVWRDARPDEIAWLEDDWCYTTLGGFASRFRLSGGRLERQNIDTYPNGQTTKWVAAEAALSNTGLLRLSYPEIDWPEDFVQFKGKKPAEFWENNRTVEDDGSVSGGDKRQVLSCTRCTVSPDGMTYDCA